MKLNREPLKASEVIAGRERWSVDCSDAIDWLKALPDDSVHCCTTSPPYWGLRDYGHPGQLGMEKTPEEYVERMTAIFREVRRVLHPEGVLLLNLGDTYSTQGGAHGGRLDNQRGVGAKRVHENGGGDKRPRVAPPGLKPKDLVGIPWMVAFALRSDGWYLRSDCIWHKSNPMTESVKDRPSRDHEYVFLLAKSRRYFWDRKAVDEPLSPKSVWNYAYPDKAARAGQTRNGTGKSTLVTRPPDGRRNCRSVWTIPVGRYRGAHFAVMPVELARKCILAGSSPKGACPSCGKQSVRILKRERVPTRPGVETKTYAGVVHRNGSPASEQRGDVCGNRDPQRHVTKTETVGWRPNCECGHDLASFRRAIVMDPFGGAGTTSAVAVGLGRAAITCELNPEYIPDLVRRIEGRPPRVVPVPRPNDSRGLFDGI